MSGGGVEQKSYIGRTETHFFPAGVLAKAISMTHSDILYRLDISTLCFYEPLQFQIFASWKFIKTQVFPFQLSLLSSTYKWGV